MNRSELIIRETPPPAPMSIFTERVVSEANQRINLELQERLERFKPLKTFKRRKLTRQARRLRGRLSRARVFEMIAFANAINERLETARVQYAECVSEAAALREISAPMPLELAARGYKAREAVRALNERLNAIEIRLQPFEAMYQEYQQLRDRLTEHYQLVERKKAEDAVSRQFDKEGRLILKYIIEGFKMTEGCYTEKFTRGGKRRRIVPKFQEVYLSSTVHSYVLLTSKKTMFGWKSKLNVSIDNLIDKGTLRNISAILHHQCYVEFDQTGSLPIFKVNRLDLKEGLPERVSFSKMLEIYPAREHEFVPLPLGLGENLDAHWMNLDVTPHILVSGQSRYGKSNLLNAWVSTLLYMQSPDEVRIIAVDNKAGVEFRRMSTLPHLVGVVNDTGDQVLPTLQRVIALMLARLRRLADTECKNIVEYNHKAEKRAARLIVFIDELQPLAFREDTGLIHNALAYICAQGAAAGVHLIAATQYARADVIPMAAKANMSGIVSVKQSTLAGSALLFNSDEAYVMEKRKGRAFIDDAGERMKLQTPLCTEEEQERGRRYAMTHYEHKPLEEWENANLAEAAELPTMPEPIAALPEPVAVITKNLKEYWTEERFIELIIECLNRRISPDVAHDYLRNMDMESPGPRHFRVLRDQIIAKKRIMYGDQEYVTKKSGPGYELVATLPPSNMTVDLEIPVSVTVDTE